ncbi:MAG: MotA/TolQ/ExbB proton channel family protein [Pirellulales bacterium]|nr:MotA/TolQ/ExbB proton channel family protein [Pirellulales bacterium]
MLRKSVLWAILLGSIVLGRSPAIFAQAEGGAAAEAKGDPKPEAKGEVKSDAAAEKETTMSGIEWFIKSSGWIGLLILGLSIYFVSLIIRLFMEMRQEIAIPAELVARTQESIKARDFQGAFDAVRQDDSFLGRVLTAGIAELPNGLPDAREALERVGEAETVEMEKRISMLAVLGTLGPMIGLLGTLLGMIESFSAISMGGQTLKANEVAGGISKALLLTFEGVSLSVPAIYFFAFFRNRVSTISVNAMLEADQLLRFFYRTGRSKGAAASVSTAPPTPPARP